MGCFGAQSNIVRVLRQIISTSDSPESGSQTSLTGHKGCLVNTFSHVVNRTCLRKSVNLIGGVPRGVRSLASRANHLSSRSALVRLLRDRREHSNADVSCAKQALLAGPRPHAERRKTHEAIMQTADCFLMTPRHRIRL